MTIVLGEVQIGDLDRFLEVFSSEGRDKRAEHGCRGARVYAPTDDSGRVIVLLEFPDRVAFERFRGDETAAPIMRKGGAQGPPSFTLLEEVGLYDH